MCPPHLFVKHCIAGAAGCLWQAQIRACGALCLSVIEAGYTTVQKRGDMTYIFLLSAPQTLSGLLPLPHSTFHKAHMPFLSFCYCTMCLGNGFKVQSSIITESAASNSFQYALHKLSNTKDYFEGSSTTMCSDILLQYLSTTTHTGKGKFWPHMQDNDNWSAANRSDLKQNKTRKQTYKHKMTLLHSE